jgi:DNA mismatch repair ATPase MutS
MLTVDSLGDSESYFFSELKRLRQLADRLEAGTECFVILDEILKGTNSKDKAEGSKSFVKKLLSLPMKGIIATHDLSLCELGNEYPDRIINRKFEIHFDQDDLVFNYRVEPGVCQNMNASFLLNKMGLSE